MSIRKRIFVPLLAFVLLFTAVLLTACGGDEEEIDPAAVVSSVSVSTPSVVLDMQENKTAEITARIATSESGADVTVDWKSDSQGVATVSGSAETDGEGEDAETVYKGTVTAVGNGVAVITVSAGNKSAVCVVAVTDTVVSDAEELDAAAAAAESGAVIALKAGEYTADVALTAAQNVSLVGAGEDEVTINGTVAFNGGGACFLSGVTIKAGAAAAAVSVEGADSSLIVRGVRIEGTADAKTELGIALAVGEGAEGQGTKLRIYDSSFANVVCAMRADSLAAVMRVGFNGCDHQFRDANGSYAEIGRA